MAVHAGMTELRRVGVRRHGEAGHRAAANRISIVRTV